MVKVCTTVGTRPEIVRLSETIKKLDKYADHKLVFTGQSHDANMGMSFFKELGVRAPDYVLDTKAQSVGELIANILRETEKVFQLEQPDALLVLGDTNSALCSIIAKRMKIMVFHWEAGNRCFDERVPEELNRRIVDHTADVNMCYTEHARRYLLREGFDPYRVFVTGSPLPEVVHVHYNQIRKSVAMRTLGIAPHGYYLVSIHREENVTDTDALLSLFSTLSALRYKTKRKIIVSTHPRTKKRLAVERVPEVPGVVLCPPFGFHDYVHLQRNAACCLSDSGTIHEDAAILGIPAVNLRESQERPEAYDCGNVVMSGVDERSVLDAVDLAIRQKGIRFENPYGNDLNCSEKVVRLIMSMHGTVRRRLYGC